MTGVVVAMSGGVDSSVAAALMVREGHDVTGVTLKLWSGPNGEAPTAGCCTVSDSEDARRVAAQLDIPYYVLDYTSDFSDGVIERFVGEYMRGRTPNPCVECNRTVKFARLLDHVADLGGDVLVTGHYARTRFEGDTWQLLRGVDEAKDQSYVLSMLDQEQLAKVRFPIGEIEKAETRRIAESLGLRTADKPDSMDICFVGSGDYRDFLRGHAPEADTPGPFVDVNGIPVGHHAGVSTVTIGQRRGLGVALGEPRYVVGVDAETATVVLGRREDLAVIEVTVDDWSWMSRPGAMGEAFDIQYRAHGETCVGRLSANGVVFGDPQYGVAPGQTIALYRGERVIGSGVIAGSASSQ